MVNVHIDIYANLSPTVLVISLIPTKHLITANLDLLKEPPKNEHQFSYMEIPNDFLLKRNHLGPPTGFSRRDFTKCLNGRNLSQLY